MKKANDRLIRRQQANKDLPLMLLSTNLFARLCVQSHCKTNVGQKLKVHLLAMGKASCDGFKQAGNYNMCSAPRKGNFQ